MVRNNARDKKEQAERKGNNKPKDEPRQEICGFFHANRSASNKMLI